MRCPRLHGRRWLATAAFSILLPAFAQQPGVTPGAEGIPNQKAINDAVASALRNALNRRGRLPAGTPGREQVEGLLTCAVPLLEVPVAKDIDENIFLRRGARAADSKMVVVPSVPPCGVRR